MNCWIIGSFLLFHVTLTGANNEIEPRREEETSPWPSQMYNSVEHYWSYCGTMMWAFNPNKYICCKGYIRPLVANHYLSRCCGSLTYNRRTHWCCGGKIRRNYLNSMYAKPRCCGRSSYNPWNQMCCDDIVVPAEKETSYSLSACCGRHSYNPFKMTCCGGKIQKLIGGFWYTRCCGNRSIDNRTEKCCNGTIRRTKDPQNTICCGNALINTREERCCHGQEEIITSVWKKCYSVNEIARYQ